MQRRMPDARSKAKPCAGQRTHPRTHAKSNRHAIKWGAGEGRKGSGQPNEQAPHRFLQPTGCPAPAVSNPDEQWSRTVSHVRVTRAERCNPWARCLMHDAKEGPYEAPASPGRQRPPRQGVVLSGSPGGC